MPRQLDQLPPDATSLARRLVALERQVKELRAARRLGAATASRIRLYAADGTTLLAELAPDASGGGGLWTRGLQSPLNISSYLGAGELSFRPVEDDLVQVPGGVTYASDAFQYSDLTLSSGAVAATDHQALLRLESVFAGQTPYAYLQSENGGECGLDVSGILTAGSLAWGQAAITPSAANVPTSLAVTGLSLKGTTFLGYATATTSTPGSQVTGVSTTSVTASGLTVWATRTNTSQVFVNWMVIGL
ncbi:hypothetical protein [Streptomyces turgidiscabies]|uniref:Tail fiber protein n=1 Tax=Streptomyces turgidiscabies TaxID=85558 RepID=A0ABU0RSA2_9ACTN|nr:hypothetical protein [Streptomyces turgidiscabies]MDQ0933810.1 hypothetical protein [Streptomyces turgidiscabies]